VINLVGPGVFSIVPDYHRQWDGVVESEAARIDDMIQKVKDAASWYIE
jgi:hypothetical protein